MRELSSRADAFTADDGILTISRGVLQWASLRMGAGTISRQTKLFLECHLTCCQSEVPHGTQDMTIRAFQQVLIGEITGWPMQ
ncbi:hypothetical protein HHA02_27810 [Cobetia marina]|jgi:hypothetical protein|nr:hypothetical protein HHA02_27810 [Cobetia marina]